MASLLMCGAAAQGRFAAFQVSLLMRPGTTGLPMPAARPGLVSASLRPAAAPRPLPADLYARQMAWTCRQEWRLEKATRLPLRLRLGSVEQTNYLEGKLR